MILPAILMLSLLASATAVAGELEVGEARVREVLPGRSVTAGFFTVTNHTGRDCVLRGGETPAAGAVEVHGHQHEDGMVRMRRVQELRVPTGEIVALEPGGYHLMLVETVDFPAPGQAIDMVLDFGDCGTLTVEMPVVGMGHSHRH